MNIFLKLGISAHLLLTSSFVSAYTVDGDLSDWIAMPTGTASDWEPLKSSVKWAAEDQNSSYLDPGYGGQKYDSEAIYVDLIGSELHIAVVTGRAPDPVGGYAGGDIALNLNWAGEGDTDFDIAIITQEHDGFSVGDVVMAESWFYGLWTEPGQTGDALTAYKKAHPTAVESGSVIGAGKAEVVYEIATFDGESLVGKLGEFTGDDQQHYVVEAMLDLELLNIDLEGNPFLAHWTQLCANDWIQVDPAPGRVPTPATFLLLGIGIIGMVGVRRRRC